MKKIKTKIIFEPGRSIVGNAGYLISKITYIKNAFASSHRTRKYHDDCFDEMSAYASPTHLSFGVVKHNDNISWNLEIV